MLGDSFTLLTADDLERAEKFYSETLGLKKVEIPVPGIIQFETGNGSKITLYEKRGTSRGDIAYLSFEVTEIEKLVEELKGKGVSFEEYDMPGLKTENSIADQGPVKAAWFKDSEGNLIGINQVG